MLKVFPYPQKVINSLALIETDRDGAIAGLANAYENVEKERERKAFNEELIVRLHRDLIPELPVPTSLFDLVDAIITKLDTLKPSLADFVIEQSSGPALEAAIKTMLSGDTISVGRAQSNTIQIPGEPTCSRKHCVITREGNDLQINDFSSQGTYVNNARIDEQIIRAGDQVRLAAFSFTVPAFDIRV